MLPYSKYILCDNVGLTSRCLGWADPVGPRLDRSNTDVSTLTHSLEITANHIKISLNGHKVTMQAMILSIALLLTPYDKLPFHFLLMFPQIYGLLRIVFKIARSIVGGRRLQDDSYRRVLLTESF